MGHKFVIGFVSQWISAIVDMFTVPGIMCNQVFDRLAPWRFG